MPLFVVYEVWTKSRVIDAQDEHDAYDKGRPIPLEGLNLCNWHAVEVPEKTEDELDIVEKLLNMREKG